MENAVGCVAMAAITLPLSFYIARGCLRVLLRVMGSGRHVL